MEEGTLSKWLVKEGDTVSSGALLAEIETDKATMEVEAVEEGTVAKLLVEAGSEGVKVNAPIAILLEEDEDESALDGYEAGGGSTSDDSSLPPAGGSTSVGGMGGSLKNPITLGRARASPPHPPCGVLPPVNRGKRALDLKLPLSPSASQPKPVLTFPPSLALARMDALSRLISKRPNLAARRKRPRLKQPPRKQPLSQQQRLALCVLAVRIT